MSTWREERRKDRAAEAEVKRADALAAAEAEAIRAAAMTEAQRAATEQQHALARQARADRAAARQARRERRTAALAGLRAWAGAHVVDLLIYPLALVSAVMAVPAMAAYGHALYGMAIGLVLPLLSELGMWAFALAVQVTRHRTPQRPVWALQVGVWLFAGVNFTLNLLHGLESGLSAGVAMGLVSVAGVVAHQLITAGPRKTRTERDTARIEKVAARKVARVRKAAVRQAVAEIGPDGAARLVYAPGRYVLTRPRRLAVRRRLEAAIVPGLPVPSAVDADLDGLDRELADLLGSHGAGVESRPADPGDDPTTDAGGSGSVATLDHGPGQQESTPNSARIEPRPGRSIEQLRVELAAAVEAGRVDPTSAESIRKTLRCAAKTARQLRDDYRRNHHQ
ncbi:hypothetical protein [Prauserella muralis]|uniref:Uncharacterized protein n=1 Tax=Prauserella muralis TaxID=588067 RepID=A0A2V4B765_9PSEU|nr:hypothetical protein [Prauserella muralis]PXY31108.1 hypothetical protein BAY60_01445 [Prauserella muralis]TWE14604.1 hypothetical protein FHX69_6761 [Prauserella muralis]